MDKRDAMQYSPLTLAFLGDSVYEQLVRKKLVLSANRPVNVLHKLTIQRVCAEYQADAVKLLLEKDILTVDECVEKILDEYKRLGGGSDD